MSSPNQNNIILEIRPTSSAQKWLWNSWKVSFTFNVSIEIVFFWIFDITFHRIICFRVNYAGRNLSNHNFAGEKISVKMILINDERKKKPEKWKTCWKERLCDVRCWAEGPRCTRINSLKFVHLLEIGAFNALSKDGWYWNNTIFLFLFLWHDVPSKRFPL